VVWMVTRPTQLFACHGLHQTSLPFSFERELAPAWPGSRGSTSRLRLAVIPPTPTRKRAGMVMSMALTLAAVPDSGFSIPDRSAPRVVRARARSRLLR
jgi:hypothetical protein